MRRVRTHLRPEILLAILCALLAPFSGDNYTARPVHARGHHQRTARHSSRDSDSGHDIEFSQAENPEHQVVAPAGSGAVIVAASAHPDSLGHSWLAGLSEYAVPQFSLIGSVSALDLPVPFVSALRTSPARAPPSLV